MSKLRERFEAWRDRMDTYNALSACRVPGERDYLIYQAALEPARELVAHWNSSIERLKADPEMRVEGSPLLMVLEGCRDELAKLLEE